MDTNIGISLYREQLQCSEIFSQRFGSLAQSKTRTIQYPGFSYTLQLNPARIISSTANINKPLDESRCFLCKPNMPGYQIKKEYDGQYFISVNPFPILRNHLTIISHRHIPQSVKGQSARMLMLAASMPGMCVFYNSPKSGASAPFHSHMQAGMADDLPVFREFESIRDHYTTQSHNGTSLIHDTTRGMILIEEQEADTAARKMDHILQEISRIYGNPEPEANIGSVYNNGTYRIVIFPREKHRPEEYSGEEDTRILVSPGFADMAGLIPCSRVCDYEKISRSNITSIMNQVSITAENLGKIDIK